MAHKLLQNVQKDQAFWLANGTQIKNLKQLMNAVGKLNNKDFSKHVNSSKHEFHSWVKDVHNDHTLAKELLRALDQDAVKNVIKRRIQKIERRPSGLHAKSSRSSVGKSRSSSSRKSARRFSVPAAPAHYQAGYHRLQAIVTSIAAVLIVGIIGITSKAASITGAVVAHGQIPTKIQFLGLGGTGGVLILLFITLQVVKHKHSSTPTNFGNV